MTRARRSWPASSASRAWPTAGCTRRSSIRPTAGRRHARIPVYRHLGDWWNDEPLVQAAFGGGIDDLDTLRRASQQLQADGLRYAVEANRRRWPRSAGTLPWQLNESFPNAWCTTAVDHRGDPKPAYFGVARAYRPIHVCARFARWAWAGAGPFHAEVWAWSVLEPADGLRAEATVRTLDGDALAAETWRVDLPDDRAALRGRAGGGGAGDAGPARPATRR